MHKALILGVNGPDGSYLAASLMRRGYNVVGVGRQATSRYVAEAPLFRYVQLDLATEIHALIDLLTANCFDVVFHTAAINGPSDFQFEAVWKEMVEVNVISLHTILEYARTNQPGLRLIYAGSVKIYGPKIQESSDESGPFNPTCLYSIGKFSGLKLIQHYAQSHKVPAGSMIFFRRKSLRRPANYFIPIIAKGIAAAQKNSSATITVRTLDFYAD